MAGLQRPTTAKPVKKEAVPYTDELKINVVARKQSQYFLGETKGKHVDALRKECKQAFGEDFTTRMFAASTEFQKHIECADELGKLIKTQPDELIEVLDLVFKWANLRLSDKGNTQLHR